MGVARELLGGDSPARLDLALSLLFSDNKRYIILYGYTR